MPRRTRIELEDIAAWANLEAALWAAARGKRGRSDVAAFLDDAPRQLLRVRDALLGGHLPVGEFRSFAIRDPKPRIIHAAPFVDRVAHHAIVRLLEPRLEQALVPTTYACRPGRGVHAAVLHAQQCTRRAPWYLKLDVEHYFPNLPHEPLLALLARRFKGSVVALLNRVVRGYEATPGRGLPIGSLTSQHFANQYLGEADRFALAHPACAGHVRYMDDTVLWCANRADARELHRAMDGFVRDELGLSLKPPIIQRSSAGLSLCGLRVYPGIIKLGLRRRRAWRSRRAHWEGRWRRAEIGEGELQRAYASLHSMTLPANARAWRQNELMRRVPPGAEVAS